jgi:hypothetical protein
VSVAPLALKVIATLVLLGSIALACLARPPRHAPRGLAASLSLIGVACCVAGALGSAAQTLLLAAAVEANAGAMWLLRCREDDEGDDGGGWGPPDDPDPDKPDPSAFDWDAFERAGRPRVGA